MRAGSAGGGGKHSRFSGVFRRPSGRHNEERRSEACAILKVILRGERRGMGLLAPKPMRARKGHPSLCPQVGTGATEAGRKVAQSWELQRPLARA